MPVTALFENWEEYDKRKLEAGNDPRLFSCDEVWEVYYLRNKIKEHYPELSEMTILEAIGKCCQNVIAPVSREKFLERLLYLLNISDSKGAR